MFARSRQILGWATLVVGLGLWGETRVLAQTPTRASTRPTLRSLTPSGLQRGHPMVMDITGEHLSTGLDVGASFPLEIQPEDPRDRNNPASNHSTQIRQKWQVPGTASLGFHRVRVRTGGGLSAFRPFCIDDFPQVVANESRTGFAAAPLVELPTVVCGRILPETSAYVRFHAENGQRVTLEVFARRLGSPLDPALQLREAGHGAKVPGMFADDTPGLQGDARLAWTCARSGDYVVEIRDSVHRGGPDAHYRLRLGDTPIVTSLLPAAIQRGTKASIRFAGPQGDMVEAVAVDAPANPALASLDLVPRGKNGLPGWPVPLLLSDDPELLAGPQHDRPERALALTLPVGVTGRFERRDQRDHYRLNVPRGQRVRVLARTLEIGSPAEVFLRLRDASGADLARSDPNREARVEATSPSEAPMLLVVEHLHRHHGPSEVYHLAIEIPRPNFSLAAETDRLEVVPGGVAVLPITTIAREDFPGPIELTVEGPAGLTGSAIVPAGMQIVPPASGQAPPPFALPVQAAGNLKTGIHEIRVRARGTHNGQERITYVSTRAAVQQQLGGLAVPPPSWCREIAVAIMPRPPVELQAQWELPEAVRGLTARLQVQARRGAAFSGPIALSVGGLPNMVTVEPRTLPAGQGEVILEVRVREQAGQGSYPLTLQGRGEVNGQEFTTSVVVPPLVIGVPFDLKVEPNPVVCEQGSKAAFQVTATRRGGYLGPIELEARNLPAGVTARKSSIAMGQTVATLELQAAENAPLGSRGDVDVLGTVSLGNQQAASGSFTVKVQPPTPALVIRIEPVTVTARAGEKVKLRAVLERRHAAGAVKLVGEGLPANFVLSEATIPAEKTEGEIELTIAAETLPGTAEITLIGHGPAMGAARIVVKVEK